MKSYLMLVSNNFSLSILIDIILEKKNRTGSLNFQNQIFLNSEKEFIKTNSEF